MTAVLLPFLLGLSIAYVVYPTIHWFVQLGFNRTRVVIILYLVLFGTLSAASIVLFPALIREAKELLIQLPSYCTIINQAISDGVFSIQKSLGKLAEDSLLGVDVSSINTFGWLQDKLSTLPQNWSTLAHLGLWIFIIPFVTFFALIDGPKWIDTLFNMTPARHVENLLGLCIEINSTLGGYIRGQILDALCVGTITSLGLTILGIDGSLVLGVLTGMLNPIPFLAPIAGGCIALLVALVQGAHTSVLVGIVLLFLGIRIIDDIIIAPFVLGPSVHLHPLMVLFSVLAGLEIGGLVGVVFAVPIVAILKVVVLTVLPHQQKNLLLKIPTIPS